MRAQSNRQPKIVRQTLTFLIMQAAGWTLVPFSPNCPDFPENGRIFKLAFHHNKFMRAFGDPRDDNFLDQIVDRSVENLSRALELQMPVRIELGPDILAVERHLGSRRAMTKVTGELLDVSNARICRIATGYFYDRR